MPQRRPTRRIAVITGSRAEFGLLVPVLRALRRTRGLRTDLIVTGMHLLRRFGRTVDEIREAGWPIAATVRMQHEQHTARDEAAALARGISGIARALDACRSDVVLVLGDRLEALAGGCAAIASRRVLAHIHGGDRAPGDIDEPIRNALTRMAHVHFAASADAARRLRASGEEPWRIHLVGAPGLDAVREIISKPGVPARVRRLLGDVSDRPYAVVVQHPIGRSETAERRTAEAILRAVRSTGLGVVAIYPNTDPGHAGIVAAIEKAACNEDTRVFRSLPREDYLKVVSRAALLIGNTSSGIIESATLGVPAVNVGPRQDGRLRCGPNVIDVGESAEAITRGIRTALRRPRPRISRSVYGDGRAGERIASILAKLKIDERLRRKGLTI